MRRIWKLSFFAVFLRLLLAAIFIYASIDKIQHPAEFAAIVRGYKVLPDSLVNLTAIILPWLELVLGALLLFGKWQEGAPSCEPAAGCFLDRARMQLLSRHR